MSYQRIRSIVDRVTYKPEYGYQVEDLPPHGVLVRVGAYVPCSVTGERNLFTGHECFIGYRLAEEQIYRELFELTLRWERHECAEYFKVDGELLFDPHAKRNP